MGLNPVAVEGETNAEVYTPDGHYVSMPRTEIGH